MGTQCGICNSGSKADINTALADGKSVREVARAFGFSRSAIHRHNKNCLHRQRTATEAARAEQKLKHAELSGDLAEAFKRAEEIKSKAEASGDLSKILKAERHLTRLLFLRQKQTGKLPSEVTVTAPRVFSATIWGPTLWPSDVEPEMIAKFGGFIENSAEHKKWTSEQPKNVRIIHGRIEWRNSPKEAKNAESNDTATIRNEARLRLRAQGVQEPIDADVIDDEIERAKAAALDNIALDVLVRRDSPDAMAKKSE